MKVLIVLYDGFVEYEYAIPLTALHYHQIPFEMVRRIFHFTALFLEALAGKEKGEEYRRWAGLSIQAR